MRKKNSTEIGFDLTTKCTADNEEIDMLILGAKGLIIR